MLQISARISGHLRKGVPSTESAHKDDWDLAGGERSKPHIALKPLKHASKEDCMELTADMRGGCHEDFSFTLEILGCKPLLYAALPRPARSASLPMYTASQSLLLPQPPSFRQHVSRGNPCGTHLLAIQGFIFLNSFRLQEETKKVQRRRDNARGLTMLCLLIAGSGMKHEYLNCDPPRA